MNMKKCLPMLASFLLLLATNVLNAQDADQLLRNYIKSLKSHKNIEVSCTLQEVSNGTVKEEEELTAYFQDKAYKLFSASQHLFSDGKVNWTYLVEDQEVMISHVTENDPNPLLVLTDMEKEGTPRLKGTDNMGDILLPTKVRLVKAMVFLVVMYGCESWTIKKAEHQRIYAFKLWCWRRHERLLDSKEIQPVHPKGDQS